MHLLSVRLIQDNHNWCMSVVCRNKGRKRYTWIILNRKNQENRSGIVKLRRIAATSTNYRWTIRVIKVTTTQYGLNIDKLIME